MHAEYAWDSRKFSARQGQSLGGPGCQAEEGDGNRGRLLNRVEASLELGFRQTNLAVAKWLRNKKSKLCFL